MELLKYKILPIFYGIISAMLVMFPLEYLNSFIFPFPENFNKYNVDSLRMFVDLHSPQIYILVISGWVLAAILAGYVTAKYTRLNFIKSSFITGLILGFFSVMNNVMLGESFWMNIVSVAIFVLGAQIGYFLKHRN